MFDIGTKVIDLNSGDIGVITRQFNPDGDVYAEEDDGIRWYVLWETGSESGKELWLPEDDLAIYFQPHSDEYLKKIEELEAEVEFLKGILYNV